MVGSEISSLGQYYSLIEAQFEILSSLPADNQKHVMLRKWWQGPSCLNAGFAGRGQWAYTMLSEFIAEL